MWQTGLIHVQYSASNKWEMSTNMRREKPVERHWFIDAKCIHMYASVWSDEERGGTEGQGAKDKWQNILFSLTQKHILLRNSGCHGDQHLYHLHCLCLRWLHSGCVAVPTSFITPQTHTHTHTHVFLAHWCLDLLFYLFIYFMNDLSLVIH